MDETVEALTAILPNMIKKQERKKVGLFICVLGFRYFQWPFSGVSSRDTRATEL